MRKSRINALRLTAKKLQEITNRYMAGETTTSLASAFGVCPTFIFCTVKRNGGKIRTRFERTRKLTPEQKEQIVSDYHNGLAGNALAKKYGVIRASTDEILRSRGVQFRSISSAKRIYQINWNAFAEITEESAYWIGFLLTDGCVYIRPRGSSYLRLSLQRRDVGHLKKFAKFMGSNAPLHFEDARRISSFHVCINQKMVDDLASFGVVPRKTHIAKVMRLEKDRHFWRGVIDGDGSIIYVEDKKRGYVYPRLSLVSASRKFIKQFSDFASDVTGIKPTIHHDKRKRGTWYIVFGGKDTIKLVSLLYADSIVSLDRKNERAQQILMRAKCEPTWCHSRGYKIGNRMWERSSRLKRNRKIA